MKQLLVHRGSVVVEQTPAPKLEPGSVLVHVYRSCISTGTELSGIRTSAAPLFKRALQKPEQMRRVLRMLAEQGWARTRSAIESKLADSPLGYSAAGVVAGVGDGIYDINMGDRVACAGAQCAFHAETICVPRNLVVPVPDNLDFAAASTATLGAIALQGVRRAGPTLGETFVVIGLGVLGQLTVQLLRAHGARTIGADPDDSRVQMALAHGLDFALSGNPADIFESVARLTDGVGADGVIITASGQSDAIVATSFSACRKKGRVVLVGDVGLDLNREDLYAKELDFLISTSYGPGRYDRHYEEEGLDYPVGYVRWTENRNLAEYIRLLAERRVRVEHLIGAEYDIDAAPQAYHALNQQTPRPLIVLLKYTAPGSTSGSPSKVAIAGHHSRVSHRVRVAIVGAGAYAKVAHLPNVAGLRDIFELHAVVSRSGHNALAAAKQFSAAYATTDFDAVLADNAVDAVVIATRHDQHAAMTLAALRAGKHVLVEKPLAISAQELAEIRTFYEAPSDDIPILMTGYNRRFSTYGRRLREVLASRHHPLMLSYRVNAGYIAPDHWVHSSEGGGRNLGEACHFYDLFTYLVNGAVVDVEAIAIAPTSKHYGRRDNFVATLRFEDGSVASLLYSALGHSKHPKEQLTAYSDGRIAVLDDYKSLEFVGVHSAPIRTRMAEKGQRSLLAAFGRAIQQGLDWPIPLWQQLQAAEIALRVDASL